LALESLFASFKRGDTIYQIAPVPLGGFVQITGLNPHEEFDHDDPLRLSQPAALDAVSWSCWQDGKTNYLTAFLIALIVIIGYGQPTGTTTIDEVLPGSAAQEAGLRAGGTPWPR